MQVSDLFNSWVAVMCVFVAGALSAWFGAWMLRNVLIGRAHSKTKELASLFAFRVEHFRSQMQTLHDHSNEYVAVFSNDEWNDLTRSIEQLENLNKEIQRQLSLRNFSEAQALLADLYDPETHPLEALQSDIESMRASAAWEDSVRGMLKRVIQNLETAAHETRRMADSASRRRTSTLVTLADVKKALLEDEVIKRGN